MKRLASVKEVDGEGLEAFLGQQITVYCFGYIYNGILEGVNKTFIKLNGAKIVYETGSFKDMAWMTFEDFPKKEWYIMQSAIESFGDLK